ncbi:mechanosensitive ion channel family protein [Streptococcus sp. X16XC17]|uniref:mechanosensitive ion channel family protein n=1 Tax=Streptococcus sp. X16XC17 TaxID=2316646 RepID=UPI001039B5A1|nr:mechanosensitive ion channel family protein [Streptococcus sp. X16XC17]TCD45573.1 mechanosensitive ion channel family protein [Streptococcus sp. X16XC17]
MVQFFRDYLAKFNVDALLTITLEKIVSLLLFYVVFFIAKQLIHVAVIRLVVPSLKLSKHELPRQKTLTRLIENVLNYTLYFILLYSILTILGLPVSSLLAGAGIAGVAVGLGAQGFLSDLVNGFFILLERQFDVGDSVRLTNGSITVTGIVVSVGIRTTQVRDYDGTLHFIPNRNMLVVSNLSRGDMRAQIDLPLPASVDLEAVRQVIEQVNEREIPRYDMIKACTILGPQTTVNGQFSYRINLSVSNGRQYEIYHRFYGLYQEALKAEGIELLAVPYSIVK